MRIKCNELVIIFQPITDDDVDRIAMCLRVLAEKLPMMHGIFTDSCRESLAAMLHTKAEEEKEYQKVCVVKQYTCRKLQTLGLWIVHMC